MRGKIPASKSLGVERENQLLNIYESVTAMIDEAIRRIVISNRRLSKLIMLDAAKSPNDPSSIKLLKNTVS